MSDSSTNRPSLDEWSPCNERPLQRMGGELSRAHRSRTTLRHVRNTLLTGAAALLIAFFVIPQQDSTLHPGGIDCATCYGMFESYEQHLNGGNQLADNEAEAMLQHLRGCDLCLNKFEDRYPGLLPKATAFAGLAASFGLFALVRRRT